MTRLKRPRISSALLIGLLIFTFGCSQAGQSKNGFDLSQSQIPAKDILQGGPPKDGIPAIDEPKFITPSEVDFLKSNDRVLGIAHKDTVKAYPIRILDFHEIVNDKIEGDQILISYCPLCGTGVGFHTPASDSQGFGVSGLLYNSDVLLYDRRTESLWSQILAKAVSGSRKGEALQQIALEHTTWGDWLKRYPETHVLSTETGFRRNYDHSPYPGYETSESLYFPVNNLNRRYHPKERILGVVVGDKTKVYPFSELSKSNIPFNDSLNGSHFSVLFDETNGNARLVQDGKTLATTTGYWFAWMAFHPDSEIYQAKK